MPDPFADLRIPLTPMAPRRQFAADLRRRLEAEVRGTDPDGVGTSPGPPTIVATRLMANLVCDGAADAIRFYVEGLGGTEVFRYVDEDKIGHAEIVIGDATFSVADPYPDFGFVAPRRDGRQSMTLTITVSDADAAFARAIAHGATVERPVEDQFYGARTGSFRDAWGHYWSVTTPLPTDDETSRS